MRIQEVENITGMDRATIRFYEREGIVDPTRDRENGYRKYSDVDVQLLLRVKLLRQLDVSLSSIKEMLQQKSSLNAVLSDQITLLEKRIQQDSHCVSVCRQMHDDRVEFHSLDSGRYLKMLTDEKQKDDVYQEPIEREVHPLRRFFARQLDRILIATILDFIVIVVLKVRPVSTQLFTVIQILGYFVAIPIEAAMLYFFGTTLGKWLMGIRIEEINGGKPSYSIALSRSFCAVKDGCGLYIPIWSLYKMYKGYHTASVGINNLWDEDTEIIYTNWTGIRKAMIAIVLCFVIILDCIGVFDSVMPGNRADNLTMAEFIENYYDYKKMLGFEDSAYILNEKGSWEENNDSTVIVVGHGGDTTRKSFQYDMDDGHVKGIHYSNEWNDINFIDAIPAYCITATFAFVGSRETVTYKDIEKLETSLNEITNDLQFENGTYFDEDVFIGKIEIQDVVINWRIEVDGEIMFANGMILTPSSTEKPSRYRLEYHVELQ